MHVPDDYNRDRLHETWREVHGWSDRAKKRRAKRRETRTRNREHGRFGKVNWEAYQHDQLYDMIHRANPGDMGSRATQWNTLAAKIEATTGDVQKVMERVMGAWHGQAAVSSAAANTRLMQWAGTASQTASQIAQGMSSYTEAVADAQSRMPKPGFATAERNFREGYTIMSTGGPSTAILLKQLLSDGMVSHEEARSRKAEAVQVMEAYEGRSKDVHDTMPHFSEAAPTTNQDVETGPGSPWPNDPAPGHTPPPGPGATPVPGGATTSASSVADPALSGRGTAGGGPGGFGGPGGLGSLGSGGSDIVRNSPGFGAGGLAGVGAVPGRRPGGAGLMGGARGAGGAGAFGGMPVGHGAQGDEDKEHRNKYDQGMDFLDDLPPAYPSVFGA